MSNPEIATQAARLQELTTEQADILKELEQLYLEWEVLAE